MMRHRILIAALLAGTIITPAIAQEPGDRRMERRAERMERGDISRGVNQGRDTGMRAAPERIERRAPDVQVEQQARPVQQAQPDQQAQPRGDWQGRRAQGWDGNGGGRGERRDAPVVNAPAAPPVVQQAPAPAGRNWRGGGNNNGGNWNRDDARQARVPGVPPTWQRGDRNNDRDGDGIRNARDRDRDNDGIRDRRDADRNNDGRIDRRFDRNNNGVIDRRFDGNRDGVRDNRNNNGQRYGNNQGWNRQWRNDNRYDWQRYRSSNRNLFRVPRYYSPYGYNYSYQRFGIGIYLDQVFFGSRYRISDPWQYRLPYAEWPYEWVRYYDDVLLVDTRNGYIVDVIHDFFW